MTRFFSILALLSIPLGALAQADAGVDDSPYTAHDASTDAGDAATDAGDAPASARDAGGSGDAQAIPVVVPGASDVTVEIELFHRGGGVVPVAVSLSAGLDVRELVVEAEAARFEAVEHGTYTLGATATGFETLEREVVIARQQTLNVALFPAGDVAIRGIVESSSGGPIAGAALVATGLGDHLFGVTSEVLSDESGAFELGPTLAGYYRLTVSAPGHETLRLARVDALGDAEIRVRLIDSDDLPEIRELGACATTTGRPIFGPFWALFAWSVVRGPSRLRLRRQG